MAIHHPPSINYVRIPYEDKRTALEQIATALQTAGWTVTAVASYVELRFTGVQSNGNAITLNGLVYQWATTIVNTTPRMMRIPVSATDAANLLLMTINGSGSAGVDYSNSTVANPDATATLKGTDTVRITWNVAGSAGAGRPTSLGASNMTVVAGSGGFTGGGYKCDTAVTPQGLQGRVYIFDNDGNQPGAGGNIRFKPSNVAETTLSAWYARPVLVAARTVEFRAHAYGFWMWLWGSGGNDQAQCHYEVPYIREMFVAPAVASISNEGGLVKITTGAPHGASTGMQVTIAGSGTGYTSLQKAWTITVVDDTSYTLNGSVWDVALSLDGSARAGVQELGQISMAYWMSANQTSNFSNEPSFREALSTGIGTTSAMNYYEGVSTKIYVMSNVRASDNNRYDHWGGYGDLMEARVGWAVTGFTSGSGAVLYKIGELWGALVVTKAAPWDTIKDNWDGHEWINMLNNNAFGSLWLTRT